MNLIDTKAMAEILGVKRSYITNHLTKRPDFPKPVVNLSQKLKRWDREEIEQYVRRPGKSDAAPDGA